MIISRTPFRTSFIGGGTDLEAYCNIEPGAVISCAIQKYVYVTVKKQLPVHDFKYRISWNKLEFTNSVDEIEHPIIREALKMLDIDMPLEITTFADIPSQTGLGSSSSFAVGLLNALHAIRRERVSKNQLATEAAQLEIRKLDRKIGTQDHYAAAYGNMNVLRFYKDLKTSIDPVFCDPTILKNLEDRLLLFYTRKRRDAGELLEQQSKETVNKFAILKKMLDYIKPLEAVLNGHRPLDEFGEILHEGWVLKKQMTNLITDNEIDKLYATAREHGAIGGKLLGAGGGGFVLVYCSPEKQPRMIEALAEYYCMPVKFDFAGTRITYYDQSNIQ